MTLALSLAGMLLALAGSAAEGPAAEPALVDLRTPDGVVLKGSLYRASRPGPGVVLFHMCDGGGRSAWDSLARRLAAEGTTVLTWNYRGVGDSGGESLRGGSLEQVMQHWRSVWGPDAEMAVRRLMSEPGVDRARIGVAGASCGAFLSMLTARRMGDAVRSVVFMAGPVDEEARRFAAGQGAPPVLGVAASGDARGAAWTTEVVKLSKHPSSRLLLFDESGHGTQLLTTQKDLEPAIAGWFRETLAAP